MKTHLRPGALLVALALAVLFVPALHAAATLDELRARGTVGERFDGYAELRDRSAPAEVKDQVAEINRKRREVYEKRAADEKVPADQVGRVYAREILQKAPAGTWFLAESGEWTQKK